MTEPYDHPVLLRVVVGSQAHGLARADSDHDYREVFAIPTSEMLRVGRPVLKYAWQIDSKFTDDEGGYEIARWLHLCGKGAPNAVEMCFAPIAADWESNPSAPNVQMIGRLMLTHKAVQDGVIGYAMNSWRKLPEHPGKWKAGMLRVLYQGLELIKTGNTNLVVPEDGWGWWVRSAAADIISEGECLDLANDLVDEIKQAPSALLDEPALDAVNEWLLDLRKRLW